MSGLALTDCRAQGQADQGGDDDPVCCAAEL